MQRPRLILALCRADAHMCKTGVLHGGNDVVEVEVHEGRNVDKVGNALNAAAQNVVSDLESIGKRESASFGNAL